MEEQGNRGTGEQVRGHLGEEVLDLYLDGGLTPEESAAVEAHLSGCARCRGTLAEVRELYAAFAAVPVEPLPIDLAPRVLRRVTPVVRPQLRWLVAAILGAQALVALVLALWLAPPLIREYLPAPVWAGVEWSAVGEWLPPGVAPLAVLAPLQWALVVAGMAVIWLIGNRMILAGAARHAVEEAG
jgi:anti-sigma factor RsiW